MTLQRISRDRKKPETHLATPASITEGAGRGKGRGRGRGKGRGRGRGRDKPKDEEDTISPANNSPTLVPAVSNKQELIGRRLSVHWKQEETDFEGFVRDFQPGADFPYEVAYDDGDEEWGYFSDKHFHTDEVNREYTWLTDQNESETKAAATVMEQRKITDAKLAPLQADKPSGKIHDRTLPSTAHAPSHQASTMSLAAQKGLLRTNRPGVQQIGHGNQSGETLPTASDGRASSPALQQQAHAQDAGCKPDLKPDRLQSNSVAATKAKAVSPESEQDVTIAPNKRRRLSSASEHNTPSKKRDSSASLPAELDEIKPSTFRPATAGVVTTTASALPVPQAEVAQDSQQQETVKEPKRRRLRKASDVSTPAHESELIQQASGIKAEEDAVQNGKAKHRSSARVLGNEIEGEMGSAAPPKATASAQPDSSILEESLGAVAGVRAESIPSLKQLPPQAAEVAAASDIKLEAAPASMQASSQPVQPVIKALQPENAGPLDMDTQLSKSSTSGIAVPDRTLSLPTAKPSVKSAAQKQKQAAAQLASNSPRTSAPASQPNSAARPGLPFQVPKLPLTGLASSTRIAMPRNLTSLSSLKTAESIPKAETASTSSPAVAPEALAASSIAADLAASEGQLQATAQQFQFLLQNTLQRTKEGVHRVREFVLKAAGGPNGKVAARRLIIMVLDYIETAQMHKRIDLFYLIDSLLQASQKEPKAGSEARTEALKMITKVIAAGLHRIVQAMGQDSECISKAYKVFEIWQRRQILRTTVIEPALQLMTKLRAEHDIVQAGMEPVSCMGQAMEGRRAMRVNLPCIPPDSQTGLPEYVMHLMLDQWASLAGFRFQGANGQQVEFKLKPQWTLPQQADIDDWDINPASIKLSEAEVLADATMIREQHLDELQLHREAKEKRERSPWGQEHAMLDESPEYGSPLSPVQQEDVDMDEAQSPDQGHTGYYSTDPNATYNFEPPRAPVHYGASGSSPSDNQQGFYGAASANPLQWSWGQMSGMGQVGSMGHMPLQHTQSMYDPFSSQLSLQQAEQPRMQQLLMDHMRSVSNSQSPDGAEPWFNVPFDQGSNQMPEEQQRPTGHFQVKGLSGQAVQGSVAVRDSNTDFDADTAWSDDDAPPPLPAEPAPPLPESQPPLPAEPSPGALPPLPPDEDQPPLPPDEATEARLASAGLFEPVSHATAQPQPPPLPSPATGFNFGY